MPPATVVEGMAITYEPIGHVRSPLETLDDAPRQGHLGDVPGRIELLEAYAAGIAGFDAPSVLVLWHAHRADRTVLESDRWPGTGIFATRSNDRPNPIGLTECRVVGVDATGVDVAGIDMIDGTPVLDLKPPIVTGDGA